MGAFGGSAIGRLGMTIAGGITGSAGELASQLVSVGPIEWGRVIGSGATGALFGFISGPGVQHGRLTNIQKVRVRQSNPNNKARHIKNLNKQMNKYVSRLLNSGNKDIKKNIIWDVVSSILDGLI